MKQVKYLFLFVVFILAATLSGCEDYRGPENTYLPETEEKEEEVGPDGKPIYPPTKNYRFISAAYFSPNLVVGWSPTDFATCKAVLDRWEWDGLSDVILIETLFTNGMDGSLVHQWNKDEWPQTWEEVHGDTPGGSTPEQYIRDKLCSREVIEQMVHYFRMKGIRVHIAITATGWLTPGSLGAVMDSNELCDKYSDNLMAFAESLGVYGIDFDYEFPTTARHREGYHRIIKRIMDSENFHVSICAIQPIEFEMDYASNYIDQAVNTINEMAYSYNVDGKVRHTNNFFNNFPNLKDDYGLNPNPNKDDETGLLIGIATYGRNDSDPSLFKNGMDLWDDFGMSGLTPLALNSEGMPSNTEYEKWHGDVRVNTPNGAYQMVLNAHSMGARGVFTWLMTHDFEVIIPEKYRIQHAIAQAVEKVWAEEGELPEAPEVPEVPSE